MSDGKLEGKVAIVTGGTRGIGAAIVQRFIDEGAQQIVVGTPDHATRKGAQVAALEGDRAVFIGVDLTEPHAADCVVDAALETFGHLDILVNNAGIDYSGVHLLDTNLDVARRVFEVNVLAPLALMKVAGRAMNTAGGAIVNIAARAGLIGARDMGAYGASKAALISLTKTAALELAPAVRVNAVAPGMTDGPVVQAWIDSQADPAVFAHDLVTGIPLGHLASPDDIASAVLYLTSDEASHITGAVLAVDGGSSAGWPYPQPPPTHPQTR